MLWEGNTHSYRRLFLDGRKPNLDIGPRAGRIAAGTWDGDTLVVGGRFQRQDVARFHGQPHSDQMYLNERYRRPDLGHRRGADD